VNVWVQGKRIREWDFARVAGREPRPVDAVVNLEQHRRIQEIQMGMPEGAEHDLAQQILINRLVVADVARDADLDVRNLNFLRLLAGCLRPFRDLLPADFETLYRGGGQRLSAAGEPAVGAADLECLYQRSPQWAIARLFRAGHGLDSIADLLGQRLQARPFRERLLVVLWDAVDILCQRQDDEEEGDDDEDNAGEEVDA
jgi:hypothetical protein